MMCWYCRKALKALAKYTRVKVFLGDVAKQAAETVAGAAGAAIGGMVVLGPVGIIGGAFVTGKSVNIPAGSTHLCTG